MGNNVTIRTNKIWFKILNDSDKLYMKNDIFSMLQLHGFFYCLHIILPPSENLSSIWKHRRWWWLVKKSGLCSALMAVEQGALSCRTCCDTRPQFLLYSAPSLMCDETDKLLLNIVLFTGNISMVYQYQLNLKPNQIFQWDIK